MDYCSNLAQKTRPTAEAVRQWAAPFENTGISTLHLCHIVAGQAAAFAALNVVTDSEANPDYRPSVGQVEEWLAQISITLSKEQLLQHVAERGVNWVVSQVCPPIELSPSHF